MLPVNTNPVVESNSTLRFARFLCAKRVDREIGF